jgi:hypothetical protein
MHLTPKEREAVERTRESRRRAVRRQFGLGSSRLFMDIENTKSTYERYAPGQQYVSGKDLVEAGHINAVSWAFYEDGDGVAVASIYNTSWEDMVEQAWNALTAAEYVIGHNFKRHDQGKLNAAFAQLGLDFPEYVIVDTLQLLRKVFAQTLPTGNALKEVTAFFGLGEPVDHYYLLYDDLQKGKKSAIKRFHEYSRHDIELTRALYDFLVERVTGGRYGE